MGSSGAGGGGGGSGGSGGGGGGSGGSGGSGGGSGGSGASGGGSGKHKGRKGRVGGGGAGEAEDAKREPSKLDLAVGRVLSRLKPVYIGRQFGGEMTVGVVRELTILSIDILENKSWASLCGRLNLKRDACLADVRDAIVNKYDEEETDARVKETVIATMIRYFEELCDYDDNLLYKAGNDALLGRLKTEAAKNAPEIFLRYHYANLFLREEPKLPDAMLRRSITDVSTKLAGLLFKKLTARYGSTGQASPGTYLQRASANPKELEWLINAIRA